MASSKSRAVAGALVLTAFLFSGAASAGETRDIKVVYKAPAGGLQGLQGDTVFYEHSYTPTTFPS